MTGSSTPARLVGIAALLLATTASAAPSAVDLAQSGDDPAWSITEDLTTEIGPGYRRARDAATHQTESEMIVRGAMGWTHKLSETAALYDNLLVESGIHLIENLNLEALASDGVEEFLFTAAPLKIRGGTGAPVRPLAFRL